MKAFGGIICLCVIMIFNLMVCSADDGLTEDQLKEIYKFSTAKEAIAIDAKNYKIYKGETTKKSTKKIWMKIDNSESVTEEAGSKKKKGAKPKESYVSKEISVFKDLKKEKKDLLKECVADMLNHGTFDGKKVLIFPRLGKNLKDYSSKAYSWDDLSKMAPCMIKALRLLHKKRYVHRNLKPEVFAFGTEKEVAPLNNQVYLFDVGLAEKYKHSNGSHKTLEKLEEFFGDVAFASRWALANVSQSRRDDIESLYYVLAHLAGFISLFEEKESNKSYQEKVQFCGNPSFVKSVFVQSKIQDVRTFNAFLDFAQDLAELFKTNSDYEKEPEYDNFIDCFDQGLSANEIDSRYKFVRLDKFVSKSDFSLIGLGNTTADSNKKVEVVMKLMKTSPDPILAVKTSLSFKTEIRIYKDLKKGVKDSLLSENICDMLDFGIYDNRRAIIMPRLGLSWFEHLSANYQHGYPYDLLCKLARYAIGALRFVHKRGYVHQDIKLDNFAFGVANKSDKSQANVTLISRMYLFDFGLATKWRYPNKTHKPRVQIKEYIGTKEYLSRAAIHRFGQSRRDDMESLMFAFLVAVTNRFFFSENDREGVLQRKNMFIKDPSTILKKIRDPGVDKQTNDAFMNYAIELNKLFVSDDPEYYEKEPDYNAFCACFGGNPGDKACDVK